MSASPASERVEITPELLADNVSAAGVAIEAGVRVIDIRPETVLALVRRIRELESTNNELWCLFEEAKAELSG